MLSSDFLRKIHSRNQPDVAAALATLSRPEWAEDLYYTDDNADLTSGGNLFTSNRALITLPTEGEQAARGELVIYDPETSMLASTFALPPGEYIAVRFDLVMVSEPDTVVESWPGLEWRGMEADPDRALLSGAVEQQRHGRELYPPRYMTLLDAPGAAW